MKKIIRRFLPVFILSFVLAGCDSNIVVKKSNKSKTLEEIQKTISLDRSKFSNFFPNDEESSKNSNEESTNARSEDKTNSIEEKAESTNNSSESSMNIKKKDDKSKIKEENTVKNDTKLRRYLRSESKVSKMMRGKSVKEQSKLAKEIEVADNKKMLDIAKKTGFVIVDKDQKLFKSKNGLQFGFNFYGYEYDKLIQVSLLIPKEVDKKAIFEDFSSLKKALSSLDVDKLHSLYNEVNKKELEGIKKGGVWGSDVKRATIIEATDNVEYYINRYETGEYYIALKIV